MEDKNNLVNFDYNNEDPINYKEFFEEVLERAVESRLSLTLCRECKKNTAGPQGVCEECFYVDYDEGP